MHTNQSPASVLASLRSLTPPRQLTFTEAQRIAEIQAARLLQLLDLTDLPVPDEAITELPRIRIQYVRDLPTSGMSFWDGQNWIIQLSGSEPLVGSGSPYSTSTSTSSTTTPLTGSTPATGTAAPPSKPN